MDMRGLLRCGQGRDYGRCRSSNLLPSKGHAQGNMRRANAECVAAVIHLAVRLARTADVSILPLNGASQRTEGSMKALTQQQVDYYHHNGFLFPIPALTSDEVAICLAGLARLEHDLGCPVADADVKWRSHAYAHSPWFNDLVRHPRILDAVEDVIGPNILV